MKADRTIKIVTGILGCVFLFFFVWTWKEEEADRKLLEEKSRISEKMESQIRDLEDEITRAERELREEKPMAFAGLAFRAENPGLMDTIVPLMRTYGWSGVLILPTDYGESESRLTEEEILQLTEEGWEIAVGGSAEELLQKKDGLENIQRSVRQAGFGDVQAFFFDRGDYRFHQEIYERLEAAGCGYGCPIGSREEVITGENSSDRVIVECQNLSMGKSAEELESLLGKAEELGAPVIFTDYAPAGTWEDWEMETPKYEEVFRVIQEEMSAGGLLQGTFREYTEYREDWQKEMEEKEQEFERFREGQEKKIEEIRRQYQEP